MFYCKIKDALGPDQHIAGKATGLPAPEVIALPDRRKRQLKQLSILDFMMPKTEKTSERKMRRRVS
jgi:hypothetical protein